MQGLRNASRALGIHGAPLPIPEPNAVEGVCGLCGKFGALTRLGYCGDVECSRQAVGRAREIARECKSESVDGLYYRIGAVELVNLPRLERWKDPKQPEHNPDYCSDGCGELASPGHTKCHCCRLEDNREAWLRAKAMNKPRRTKGRDQRPKHINPVTNRIKGWEKVGV